MSNKKKFKETGFGKLLLQKIPSAAGIVGDLLPDKGVMGIVKNIINRADITDAEKDELLQAHQDYELEVMRIDAEDRDSARTREVKMAQAGRSDWMMNVSGIFALLSAIAIVYVVLFLDIKGNVELFFFVAGAAFGWATQVISFYFGSSKGSKDKDGLKKFMQ